MRLKDKVAIITGATSGMGRAAAVLFAKEGCRVVVNARNADRGNETVEEIKKAGGEAVFVQGDASNTRDVQRVVATAVRNYGKLDILYNNAGVITSLANLVDTEEEDWDRMMLINAKSVFLNCKYAIPELIKNGGGAIINTSSASVLVGYKTLGAYSASKSASLALTRTLAIECAPHNIRVNAICPGTTGTNLGMNLWGNDAFRARLEETAAAQMQKNLIKPIAVPEDIAYAALYLASDEASFTTGAVFTVDGGYSCY